MSFPHPVFETLLLKLANALEIAQKESTTNAQARQALYQAVRSISRPFNFVIDLSLQTTDFKDALTQAKQLAISLPGGELLISEQNAIIAMLESLRDAKQ